MSKKKLCLIIGIPVLCVALILGIIYGIFAYRESKRDFSLDIAEYVTVEFTGNDTVGTAKVVFDGEKFTEDFLSYMKKPSEKKLAEAGLSEFYAENIAQKISFRLSQDSSLANGDRIIVTVNYNEEAMALYHIVLSEDVWSVTVSGLTELITIDLFETDAVSFAGMSPYVTVKTVPYEKHDLFINFTVDADEHLRYGDTVTAVAGTTEVKLAEAGYRAETLAKTYEIPVGDRYVTEPSQIGDAMLRDMKDEAEAVIEAYGRNVLITIHSYEYIGKVVACPENITVLSPSNKVYLIYKVEAGSNYKDWKYKYFYYPIEVDKVLIENGHVSYSKVGGILGSAKDYPLGPLVYAKGYVDATEMLADLGKSFNGGTYIFEAEEAVLNLAE